MPRRIWLILGVQEPVKLTGNVKRFFRMNDFCTSDAIASHTQSVLLRKVVWRQKWIVKARVLANRVSKGGYRMPIYQKILVFKNCNLSLKNHWNLVVWRCSGGSREGPRGTCHPPPPPLLFLDQTQARRAKTIFFWRLEPPSGWPPPPPPYLKVCIRHWVVLISSW